MKGVVYLGDGAVETREFAVPEPSHGEVLIEMKAAGLCGSDLHKYHKDTAWADARHGMIAGHEPSGLVAAVGPGVDNVSVGDRVSVYHSLGCGSCVHCSRGEPVFCRNEGAFGRTRDGCHADYMTAPAEYCIPLDPSLSFATGTFLACTTGTAYNAAKTLPLVAGDTVVVFGLGPVGLSAVLLAQAMGYRVIGVEVNECRLELAARVGARTVINAASTNVVDFVRGETDGEGARGLIECSGNRRAREQAVEAAAMRGTIVAVGVGDEPYAFNANSLIRHGLTIHGNAVYSVEDQYEVTRFVTNNGVDLDAMITHRYSIDDAAEAFAEFDSGRTGKVIFEW